MFHNQPVFRHQKWNVSKKNIVFTWYCNVFWICFRSGSFGKRINNAFLIKQIVSAEAIQNAPEIWRCIMHNEFSICFQNDFTTFFETFKIYVWTLHKFTSSTSLNLLKYWLTYLFTALADEVSKEKCMLQLLHSLPDVNYYCIVSVIEHLVK